MATTVPSPVLDTRDEAQLAAQAIGGLPSELSDRGDSNPAVVIAEACAYLAGRLQYQLNRWPQAVVQKALALVGVTLNAATSATVSQSFTLSSPRAADTVIPTGTQVSTSDGATVFSTTADVTIAAYSAPAGTVSTTAGSATVTGSGTSFVTGSTWVGYQIQIPQNTGPWYTISSVTNGTSLVLSTTASATTSGASWYVGPVTGSVNARATSTGSATNVGAATLTALVSSVAGVASTTNAAAATGGADQETTTAAVARAPEAFASRDMAITAEDYAAFAVKAMGQGSRAVARANTNVDTATNGYVTVACLGPGWSAATPATAGDRALVVRDLNGRTAVGTTTIDIAATIYQPQSGTGVSCAVYRKATYDAATVRANVGAAINSYLNPNTYPWNRTIYVTDLVQVIESTEGVDRLHHINGVAAVGTDYRTAPAAITFAASTGPHTTANTANYVAGQTFIIDATNNAVYLVTAISAGASITTDRAWAGTVGASSPKYFTSKDDDMNSGNGLKYYYLPKTSLNATAADPPPQVVVVGSV